LVQDQSEVLALLQDPATYGRAAPVIRIDTHGAIVFLAGPDVYKVKRAIRFRFMDFSTLQKRHAACEAEMVVNRANAPGLYLGVVPVSRGGAGLRLGGGGEVVEWTVHLRRFDETGTFEHLAAQGPLGPALIDALARAVVAAHRRAPVKDGAAATRVLHGLLLGTVDELVSATDIFPPKLTAEFGLALVAAFAQAEPLLQRRGLLGQVRRCHGDLHLGNVALIDGAPVLFDALEFDEAIATCDVLYDLAFLLMDLSKLGRIADAALLLDRYLAAADDPQLQIAGLGTLPLFLSLRAAIRAKVVGAMFCLDPEKSGLKADALAYLAAAVDNLAGPRWVKQPILPGT
jgi:aminoglycoside phosphotransferase family enzyme